MGRQGVGFGARVLGRLEFDRRATATGAAFVLAHAPKILAILAMAALCGVALWISLLRSRFPLDLYMWSESPFLTNILKLESGLPIYGDPEQANSFVYAPGLEYIDYYLFKLLGVDPADIRLHRLMVIVFGVAACVLLATSLPSKLAPDAGARFAAGAVFFLILARNPTFDAVHPDNLHVFFVCACLFLTRKAIDRASIALACAAVAVGCVATLAKQTGFLLAFAAAGSFLFLLRKPLVVRAALIACACAGVALAVLLLWREDYARFYTLDVLARHSVEWARLPELYYCLVTVFPWGWLLAAGVLGAVAAAATRDRTALVYGCFFVLACTPPLLAFLKPLGAFNNLVLVKIWSALFGLYLLRGLWAARREGVAALIMLLCALAAMRLKYAPDDDMYRYRAELSAAVGAAVSQNRHVLLAHGATPLIDNGLRKPPLDRANSYLELANARLENLTGTVARLDAKFYDVLLINSPWYGEKVEAAIARNYRLVSTIRGAPVPKGMEYGYLGLFQPVKIYERR